MPRSQTILVVEDNPTERLRYSSLARELGMETTACATLEEAVTALANTTADFLLTDIHLGHDLQSEGLSLIQHAREEIPTLTVLAMSSDPNVVVFERAMALGAHHFIKKPILNTDDLAIGLDLALERRRNQEARKREEPGALGSQSLKNLCPEGVVIRPDHLRLAESAARNPDIPVLLLGETGTGKEEIAKLIHRKRSRAEGVIPLVIVNCANLNEGLLESALFGHKKGAFSGASETTTGFVGEADGGILFLDEIHTLDHKCQQKLLRVLNDGSYQRLGDTRSLSAKFQVLAASTRDLDDEVEHGRFLIDLRMRLTGLEIRLPPLRERMEDLRTFILLFLARAELTIPVSEVNDIEKRCRQFYWRGNVRQLFMALNVMAAISRDSGTHPRAEHLPVFKSMLAPDSSQASAAIPNTPAPISASSDASRSQPIHETIQRTVLNPLTTDAPFHESVERYEHLLLKQALERYGGNMAQACLALRLGRSSFELKRKKYGLTAK